MINIGSLQVTEFGKGLRQKEYHCWASWSCLWGNPAVIFHLISWKARYQFSFSLVNWTLVWFRNLVYDDPQFLLNTIQSVKPYANEQSVEGTQGRGALAEASEGLACVSLLKGEWVLHSRGSLNPVAEVLVAALLSRHGCSSVIVLAFCCCNKILEIMSLVVTFPEPPVRGHVFLHRREWW